MAADLIARALSSSTALSRLGIDVRRCGRAATPSAEWLSRWTVPQFTPSFVTAYDDRVAPYGDIGITPQALFDLFSTARSAPGKTIYVNGSSGSDSSGDGSSANPYATMALAVTKANAGGVPTTIFVAPGDYNRGQSPANGGAAALTVDSAFIVNGTGRVRLGVWDDFAALSADATYTNTYTWTVPNADRVVDRTRRNRFGNYVELDYAASVAACNATPNTWFYDGTKLYVNRFDGAAVTAANTRIYRANVNTLAVYTDISLYLEGFDFEGGQGAAVLFTLASRSDVPASMKAYVANNCSFRYAGGKVNSAANGFGADSIHGLAAAFNCRADANRNDGFNLHKLSPNAARKSHMLTVNCTGFDNGRYNSQSNNGWTNHDDTIGLDVCGVYRDNHGGTLRSVNDGYGWFVSTLVANDIGDEVLGGAILPRAVSVGNTAKYWLDNVQIDMPAAAMAVATESAGTAVYMRNMPPLRVPAWGFGTVAAY